MWISEDTVEWTCPAWSCRRWQLIFGSGQQLCGGMEREKKRKIIFQSNIIFDMQINIPEAYAWKKPQLWLSNGNSYKCQIGSILCMGTQRISICPSTSWQKVNGEKMRRTFLIFVLMIEHKIFRGMNCNKDIVTHNLPYLHNFFSSLI